MAELGAELVGEAIWNSYQRWPVYSKFFDNLGPIPHHMHQSDAQAKLVGQEGKPESYYFPPQLNAIGNNFPYTFFGLEPGTTKEDIGRCLERWNEGDNGILDLSKAYRLQPGTGWLVPPCVLHAPGSLVTYEPQWGSDVFGMYQSMVEGRAVPWELLVKDVPKEKHHDLDYLVDALDWEGNVNPNFKDHHYLEPIPVADTAKEGYVDRWIVYGKVDGKQLFTAKELTVEPGVKCTIKDNGAYGLIAVQGERPDRQAAPANAGHDPLRRADRGRGLRQREGRRGTGSCSRTPAASRSSPCATSAPTRTRTRRTSATTRVAGSTSPTSLEKSHVGKNPFGERPRRSTRRGNGCCCRSECWRSWAAGGIGQVDSRRSPRPSRHWHPTSPDSGGGPYGSAGPESKRRNRPPLGTCCRTPTRKISTR